MHYLQIDVVLDVGANVGQYAIELRKFGYKGRIVSFEPLKGPYATLKARAARDRNWTAVNAALGDTTGVARIHVTRNLVSSSFLEMRDMLPRAEPDATVVGYEDVEVMRLDDVIDGFKASGAHNWLKVDAQGFESRILDGAEQSLARLAAIQIELSLVPTYEGAVLVDLMVRRLGELGFGLEGIEPGLADPSTGRLMEVDGLFVRRLEQLR